MYNSPLPHSSETLRPCDRWFLSAVSVSLLILLVSCAGLRREAAPGRTSGMASWYGSDFHGRPTSSGEVFDMYKLTCAHREHPFGTRLMVTNAANRKSIECLVNDRGPFVSGRDLDLSYAAAKEIGLIGPGVARVELEVTGRDLSYVKKVKVRASAGAGPFSIQAGSFSDRDNAVRLKDALGLRYEKAFIEEAAVNGSVFFRVKVGSFGALDEALPVAGKMAEEGYPTLVVRAAGNRN